MREPTPASSKQGCRAVGLPLKVSAICLAAALLSLALVGVPRQPLSVILGLKKVGSPQQPLLLPSSRLSVSLGVNSCSNAALEALYDSAANTNMATSGLKLFERKAHQGISAGIESPKRTGPTNSQQ